MAKNSYVYPKALEVGPTDRVVRAVSKAAGRHGTREATSLFTDEDLQQEVFAALTN